MSFTRTKENFICGHCGYQVEGDGYTNHCSACLWSKHVDIEPGDRKEECGGMMEPIDIYLRKQDWVITHRCQVCGYKRNNRVGENDNFNEVIRLEKEINEKKVKK
jgi:hypothetical protein